MTTDKSPNSFDSFLLCRVPGASISKTSPQPHTDRADHFQLKSYRLAV
jgi:hypothetical protein